MITNTELQLHLYIRLTILRFNINIIGNNFLPKPM